MPAPSFEGVPLLQLASRAGFVLRRDMRQAHTRGKQMPAGSAAVHQILLKFSFKERAQGGARNMTRKSVFALAAILALGSLPFPAEPYPKAGAHGGGAGRAGGAAGGKIGGGTGG